MKRDEKEEMRCMDKKYRTFGGVHYFFANLFYCIPVLGWFFAIFAACNKSNITRRSIARGMFFGLILFIIICGLIFLGLYLTIGFDAIKEFGLSFVEPGKAIADIFVKLYQDVMAAVTAKIGA